MTSMPGACSFRRAAQRWSMDVVAIRRKEAIRQSVPFSIRVSMETTPPDTGIVPRYNSGVLSKNGLKRPTANTSGSTIRSL